MNFLQGRREFQETHRRIFITFVLAVYVERVKSNVSLDVWFLQMYFQQLCGGVSVALTSVTSRCGPEIIYSQRLLSSVCVGRLGLVSVSGMSGMLMGKFCGRHRYVWNRGNFADCDRFVYIPRLKGTLEAKDDVVLSHRKPLEPNNHNYCG